MTLPGSPGARQAQPPAQAHPCARPTGASMTPVTTDTIRSFYSLRGRSHDRLARTASGSRSTSPATPALLPSDYLLAALALLVLAPPAILGWLPGVWVVRCGWVSRGRLAAAGGVTGTRVHHGRPHPSLADQST
jgi:hypothetical protein